MNASLVFIRCCLRLGHDTQLPWRGAVLLATALTLTSTPANARPGDGPQNRGAKTEQPAQRESGDVADREISPERQRQLAYGYAMLHEATAQLSHIDKTLWLKREAKPVRTTLKQLAETMKSLTSSLESLAARAPVIDLADNGLPRYEIKKRNAVYLERGLDVGVPLLGRTGTDFERVLLLSMSAAVNQQKHLANVMQNDEPIPSRRQWLRDAEMAFDSRYTEIVDLLESRYFCPDPN